MRAQNLRTIAIATMATTLLTGPNFPGAWGAKGAVQLAEEIMVESEALAIKAKELQEALSK